MHKMAPETTITTAPLPVRKNQKERFTTLALWNADESQNSDLMFIGHAQYPRPFKKKYEKDYGLAYHFKKSMTADLFLHGFSHLTIILVIHQP